MTINVFPVDAVDTNSDGIVDTPAYTGRQLRQLISVLTGPAPSGRPLGAVSGVRPGTPTTTVTATSTTWTCGTHAGVLDLETAAVAGPYLYAVGVAVSGAMTPADGSNPRVDIIYAQLSDPAEADGSSAPKVDVLYLAGTPNANPSAPATPARSMVLAQISVPKATTGSPSVTWVAPEYGATYFQAHQAGTNNIATSGSVWATVPVDTLDFNPGQWKFSGGGLLIPATGTYKASGVVAFASGNAGGSRGSRVALNGSGLALSTALVLPSTFDGISNIPTLPVLVHANAGDVLVLQGLQNSGGTLATQPTRSGLVVERVG